MRTDIHNLRIARKEHQKLIAENKQQRGKRDDRAKAHAKPHTRAALHAVILACAEVLPGKCRHRNAKRVHHHPDKAVNLADGRPSRDSCRAKAVDARLNEDIRE